MKLDLPLNKPLHDYLPQEWKESVNLSKLDYCAFRNLVHFKNYVTSIPLECDAIDVSYEKACSDLINESVVYDKQEYESIRNLVRTNLLKRGLISEDVYESFKYSTEGAIVDIAKVAAEDPECFLTPVKSYTNHFYELFVSASYPYHVTNSTVRNNAIKLLSTIEELERQHIYIKVTVVTTAREANTENRDLLITIPLFNYKDIKSIETMSSVINENLLRGFCFAAFEDIYGDSLNENYGLATELPQTICIGDHLDEIELFTKIYDQVIVPGSR
jgi:hypothetical protein